MDTQTPPSPAPAVRDRILAAAVQLLHEKGIGALTQARVSEMAGVRQSHLTYYFPTRNDLLQQTVFSVCGSVLGLLEDVIARRSHSLVQLRKALEEQLADKRMARMFAGLTVASEEDPSLKPWIDSFQTETLDRLQKALQAIGLNPPRIELEVFRATIVGALQMNLGAGTEQSWRRALAIYRVAFRRLVHASRPRRTHTSRSRRPAAS